MHKQIFIARAGMTIRASTGYESIGVADRMSTILFYEASPGDTLRLLDRRYLFNVATYAPYVDEKYIYTYSYQPNQSWTTYNNDLSADTYRVEDYLFSSHCFFRLCFKRADGMDFDETEAEMINEIITFARHGSRHDDSSPGAPHPPDPPLPACLDLSREVLKKIQNKRTESSLMFALLSDSHYTVNGTWGDTLKSLMTIHEAAAFDGIIHLGDMTDGMVTAASTKHYVGRIINDLTSLGIPLYIAIGNHDTNYFNNNTEPFTIEEQCKLYLSHSDAYTIRKPSQPWYYKDFHEHGLRFIFLHSYDYTQERRYGFSSDCLQWLEETLEETPHAYDIILFSHLTPLVKLQHWTDFIRGGAELTELLEKHNAKQQTGKILAYINGHNHADHIYQDLSFPIVSIGCAKTEYFLNYKPEGSTTPPRRLATPSQELWDALIITPKTKNLEFIRYGAGSDRIIKL